jgi:ribosome biogenesis GTPase / thiamine phosphate phosphatase
VKLTLTDLGWDPVFQYYLDELDDDELIPARVVRAEGNTCRLLAQQGELTALVPASRLRGDSDERPTVGDWCALAPVPGGGGELVVKALLPRRASLSRKAAGRATAEQVVAANVDTVLVVVGLDADFNLRRIERYLTLAVAGGASALVVLNKADACDDLPGCLAQAQGVSNVPVLALSAQTGAGVEALEALLEAGKTYTLLGSSGAGKSTLINRLLGEERLVTAEVRARDGRGQHTTTHREIVPLPGSGALLVDNPGMRELGLWADQAALDATFDEIAALAQGCRFNDCTHAEEPGCAVTAAVEAGELQAARLQSYHKLQREIESAAIRRDEHTRREVERRTWGKIRKQGDLLRKLKQRE